MVSLEVSIDGGIYRDTAYPENPGPPVFFGIITTDRGDVVELLDANGSPFTAYRYDAWGNPPGAGTDGAVGIWAQETLDDQQVTVISEALAAEIATRQVLRYASYCFDSESEMFDLSCRHYDPATCCVRGSESGDGPARIQCALPETAVMSSTTSTYYTAGMSPQ
jgi:hypothetical protein